MSKSNPYGGAELLVLDRVPVRVAMNNGLLLALLLSLGFVLQRLFFWEFDGLFFGALLNALIFLGYHIFDRWRRPAREFEANYARIGALHLGAHEQELLLFWGAYRRRIARGESSAQLAPWFFIAAADLERQEAVHFALDQLSLPGRIEEAPARKLLLERVERWAISANDGEAYTAAEYCAILDTDRLLLIPDHPETWRIALESATAPRHSQARTLFRVLSLLPEADFLARAERCLVAPGARQFSRDELRGTLRFEGGRVRLILEQGEDAIELEWLYFRLSAAEKETLQNWLQSGQTP